MSWWNWKAKRRLQRRREGWDFAAGMLLENPDGAPEQLQNHIDDAHVFGTWNDFDDGVEAALQAHAKRN